MKAARRLLIPGMKADVNTGFTLCVLKPSQSLENISHLFSLYFSQGLPGVCNSLGAVMGPKHSASCRTTSSVGNGN